MNLGIFKEVSLEEVMKEMVANDGYLIFNTAKEEFLVRGYNKDGEYQIGTMKFASLNNLCSHIAKWVHHVEIMVVSPDTRNDISIPEFGRMIVVKENPFTDYQKSCLALIPHSIKE